MKRTNLTIKSILAIFMIAITMSSCDLISGVDLTDQKSVDKLLPARIDKHIDPQSVIFEIMFGTTSDFSVEMDIASVKFLAPSETEPKNYAITIPGNQKPRETKVTNIGNEKVYSKETGIKLCDIDFSKIPSNVAKAKEIMKESNMELSGIASYTIKMDGNPANTIHEFRTTSKADTKMGNQNGRAALVTNYYEFKFTANPDGVVTFIGE